MLAGVAAVGAVVPSGAELGARYHERHRTNAPWPEVLESELRRRSGTPSIDAPRGAN